MERSDIINAAIKLEEDGKDFYLRTASGSSNDLARRTFESFAKDEAKHIEWFKCLLEGGDNKADPDAVKEIYRVLRGIFSDIDESSREQLKASDNDIECITIAIGKEEESISAYSDWAQKVEDHELRKLFEILVEAEKEHRKLLNNTKEYLANTGDWFMSDEQWSFDGG